MKPPRIKPPPLRAKPPPPKEKKPKEDVGDLLDNYVDITDRFDGAVSVVARLDLSRGGAIWGVDLMHVPSGCNPQSPCFMVNITTLKDPKALATILRWVKKNRLKIVGEAERVVARMGKRRKSAGGDFVR